MKITELLVEIPGGPIMCSLAGPEGMPAPEPALLLTFATTRRSALAEDPHRLPARIFTEAGHYALSFDLPNHGERIGSFGEGIDGMCARGVLRAAPGRRRAAHPGCGWIGSCY